MFTKNRKLSAAMLLIGVMLLLLPELLHKPEWNTIMGGLAVLAMLFSVMFFLKK